MLNVLEVAYCCVPGCRSQLTKHLPNRGYTGGHFACQTDFCVVLIAKQTGLLLTQRQDPGDQRIVVQFACRRPCNKRAVKLFAQCSVATMFHEGGEQRGFKRNPPGALCRGCRDRGCFVGLIPGICRKVPQRRWPTRGINRIRNFERKRFGRIEDMVRKVGGKLGKLLFNRIEPRSFRFA